MHNPLSDLKSVTGVMGSFIYDGKQGVLSSDMPTVFTDEKLYQAGRTITRVLAAGATGFPEAKNLVLVYTEMLIFMTELNPDSILVVMCNPTLNVKLLTMSVNLAMDDLAALATKAPLTVEVVAPAQPVAPQPVVAEPVTPPVASYTVDSIRQDVAYAETLSAMQVHLAKVMGPMAMIVLEDSLSQWIEAGDVSTANYPSLVELICRDIDDTDRAGKFKELVAEIIG